MGTITARKRKDGSTGYTGQIVRKKDGAIVLREAKTFDSKREATAWIVYREAELDKPGGLERAVRPPAPALCLELRTSTSTTCAMKVSRACLRWAERSPSPPPSPAIEAGTASSVTRRLGSKATSSPAGCGLMQ